MNERDRLIVAALCGVVSAVLCWVISTALHAPHVWPGTIMAFAMVTASNLLLWRRRR